LPTAVVSVTVLLEVEGSGLKAAVTPVAIGRGKADAAVKAVRRVDGDRDVPVLPRATLRLLGDAED